MAKLPFKVGDILMLTGENTGTITYLDELRDVACIKMDSPDTGYTAITEEDLERGNEYPTSCIGSCPFSISILMMLIAAGGVHVMADN